MHILAVYGSNHGQTEAVVRRVAAALEARGHAVRVLKGDAIPADVRVEAFDAVVVGASILVGRHQAYIVRFVQQNRDALRARPGAFISVNGANPESLPAWRAEADRYVAQFLERTGWTPRWTAAFSGALRYPRVTDPFVRQMAGYFEKGLQSAAASTVRRSFLLGFDPVLRGCLAQTGNIFDIRQMMDWGVSLIVNLGSIQQAESRRLMGSLLMVQIEQAALSRAEMPAGGRRPWHCYVDEWPQMAATQRESLDNLLTQARKYNLRLCLAGQSPAQIEAGRLAGALEQCRMSVTFRLGAESAARQAKEIAVLDLDPAQAPASAQMRHLVQDIQNLPSRVAYAKIAGEEPIRFCTLEASEPPSNVELGTIVTEYRSRYQTPTRAEAAPFEGMIPPLGAGDVSRIERALQDTGSTVVDFAAYFGEPGEDTYDDAD